MIWPFRKAAPSPQAIEEVPPTSPARLLAASMTDPETRGEWEIAAPDGIWIPYTCSTTYQNKARDIRIVSSLSVGYGSSSVFLHTPFTLSEAEKQIVRDGIAEFHRHLNAERERAALARLAAPKPKGKGK